MIIINILFCGDKNIKDGILLCCLSLADNTKEPLNIYILTAHIENGQKVFEPLIDNFADNLQNTLKRKNASSTVTLIDISNMFCENLPEANMDTRFTPLCMLRLFADKVDIIPDKILYLDCDILCRKDFSDFYNQDMGDTEIIGVPDRYGKWFFSRPLWRHNYLNSGVLLMNMKNIRHSRLLHKCRKLCKDKKMFMPDQTALNKLAVKRTAPSRYNNQGKIKNCTVFKHFTTFFKFLPYFHSVTVKPWDIEKLHNELKIYEFDNLITDFQKEKQNYEQRNTDFLYH